MRVCLDFQAAIAQQAGVGRYTLLLADHLAKAAGPDQLELFFFDFKRSAADGLPAGAEAAAVRWCPGRLAQAAWKTLGWPPFDWFAGAADVYHFPNFILPPCRRGKRVVTIHDVSFMRHPEYTEDRNLAYLEHHIRKTVSRADAIITDSHFSAAEIQELLHVPADRIHAIHLGISDRFTAPPEPEIRAFRARMNLARPYLLSVGTLEPRKNYDFLIDVFEALPQFDGDLVIAGMPGWKLDPILKRIRTSPKAAQIRYLQYVPLQDLPSLYAGAELFAFPSHYEGFGFPPLEALACGTPVISSTAASLPEVLDDAATLLATDSRDAWVAAIESILQAGKGDADRIERGCAQARKFRWDCTAQETWKLYREIA
ncbi:MAG: glycosyltransferase family 1 protein [Verrucomicrobia bacterium]|nr:glycosyltransferase family 1 protein [Verrucomicrobiota bacterium]MDA1085776.1 glycosyltransferase family 1 protein [Verrucomicrobiota bacterium]